MVNDTQFDLWHFCVSLSVFPPRLCVYAGPCACIKSSEQTQFDKPNTIKYFNTHFSFTFTSIYLCSIFHWFVQSKWIFFCDKLLSVYLCDFFCPFPTCSLGVFRLFLFFFEAISFVFVRIDFGLTTPKHIAVIGVQLEFHSISLVVAIDSL